MNPLFVFETVIALSVQLSIVVLATVAMERWLDDSKALCRLWTACFLTMLGLVAAAMLLPHFRAAAAWPEASAETVISIVNWQTGFGNAFVIVWGLGVGIMLVRRAFRYRLLSRFLRNHCEPLSHHAIDSRLRSQLRLPSDLQLCVSEKTQSPFCWQLHRPIIVIPRFVLDEGGDALRHVLLHELEHLRTNHPVQLFLQRVCATLLWFHPAVWFAGKRAELAREYVCDEAAAKADGKVANYLRTLVKIAEQGTATPSCVLAFGRRRSAIARRADRLVNLAQKRSVARGKRQSIAMTTLLLVCMMTTQLWLPVNVLASSRSGWSPWPTWSARVLHDFGVSVRDFEPFDERRDLHDLMNDDD